ncbi:hypothetical protein ACRB68_25870 [Actinomadura sp. RB68]|uniref:Uncharacterized protein n=1 Tax=Actinomadura macrotermitis TaxID=2585200 RepID=A0A7K0BUH4_9ACTN|nr:hypothetical protein [Actinomadura macrotermitis]
MRVQRKANLIFKHLQITIPGWWHQCEIVFGSVCFKP